MDIKTEALDKELKAIKQKLDSMVKKYGHRFDFVFFATVFDAKQKYEFGVEGVYVANTRNYRLYKDTLYQYELRHRERKRFQHLLKLGEFRVICVNAMINYESAEVFEREQGDWLRQDRSYVVTGVKDALVEGGLVFELKNIEGKKLFAPFPFNGYNSVRFMPEDYTKLN